MKFLKFGLLFAKYFSLFAFAFSFFQGLVVSDVIPDLYQARDLGRAARLLSGEFIWHGPELTGGGHAPGPFYYWLLAIPLALGKTWVSALVFECLLAAVAAVALFEIFERRISQFAALVSFVLFLNSLIVIASLHTFWNPSYLFLFQVLIIGALWCDRPVSSSRLAVAGVLLGLSLQIHLTQLLFLFGAFAWIAFERAASAKERLRSLAVLSISTLLPLLPYFVWRSVVDSGAPSVTEALRALFERGNLSSETAPLELLEFFMNDLFWLPCLGAWMFTRLFSKTGNRSLPGFIVLTFVFTLPLWLKVTGAKLRYVEPFFLCLIVIGAVVVGESLSRSERWLRVWLATAVCFFAIRSFSVVRNGLRLDEEMIAVLLFLGVLTIPIYRFTLAGRAHRFVSASLLAVCIGNFVLYLGWKDHHLSITSRTTASVHDLRLALAEIKSRTGWDYDRLRPRLFITGVETETDFEWIYSEFDSNAGEPREQIDGVLAIYEISKIGHLKLELNGILGIPEPLRTAEATGAIVCTSSVKAGNYELCFYRGAGFRPLWNNVGNSYRPPERIDAKPRYSARYSACNGPSAQCDVHFLGELRGMDFELKIVGAPLAVPDPAINPRAVVRFDQLRLMVDCGRRRRTWPLASSVGHTSGRMGLLAPMTFHASLHCENPDAILVVSPSGEVVKGQRARKLAGTRIELR
ncbi:MAG: glycosyltransferase family 39 protein [Bdellovibrionota bacterium]